MAATIHQHSPRVHIARWFTPPSEVPTWELTWEPDLVSYDSASEQDAATGDGEQVEEFASLAEALERAEFLLDGRPCADCEGDA